MSNVHVRYSECTDKWMVCWDKHYCRRFDTEREANAFYNKMKGEQNAVQTSS